MRASVAAAWPALCSAFEGRCWFMYLDTKRKVTTGLGFLIDGSTTAAGVKAAQALPWTRLNNGLPATPTDIEIEWKRVKKLTRLAPLGGFEFKPSAKLRLPEAEIDRLLMVKTAEWWSTMLSLWPELESWPADAQLAYMDEAWQNGMWFTESKEKGEYIWVNTRAAFQTQDWDAAAKAVPGSGARADTRKRLFRNAAKVAKLGIDRDILWNTRTPIADIVPADPPPSPQPGPISQPGTRSKPEHGSKTDKIFIDRWGKIIPERDRDGSQTTTRTLNMWLEAVYLYHQAGGVTKPYWTQGGFNNSKGTPSAGTHDGDACDTSIIKMTAREKKLWELCTWIVGFAGWIRLFILNLWPEHWHGIPKGGVISGSYAKGTGAAGQVKQFEQARTGLVGWGMYARIAKMGVGTWTWEDYLAGWGVSLATLRQSFDDGKVRDDVKDLQLALSKYVGADVVGDGQLGPQTKAALAKVGPLDTATLTTLGLEVNP